MSTKSRMKSAKKVGKKIIHSPVMMTYIPAGLASAQPPLGPNLGQRNINVAAFCKDFNEKTAGIKEGIPIPCRIKVKADGKYDLVMHTPPVSYFLKQAAGIQKAKLKPGEVAGKITFKHLYEIAVIKSQDPALQLMSLKDVCKMLVGTARTCGIKIERELDPIEHEEFMREREQRVEEFKQELKSVKEAKLLKH